MAFGIQHKVRLRVGAPGQGIYLTDGLTHPASLPCREPERAQRVKGFWELVGDRRHPDGLVFFVDDAHPELARAAKPEFFDTIKWRTDGTSVEGIDSATDLRTSVATRCAADSRSYNLVKIW